MEFQSEAEFEKALIKNLQQNGWDDEGGVIRYPTEADLLQNWANILFENNKDIDRLNGCPLTEGEMQQILEKIVELRTPLALNGFINGKTVAITRDNPDDALHFEKEVSLKIYDRREIAAGQSRYQIVQQPKFATKSPILNERRGDVMLLINGMPVIHIELKRSGIPVSRACNQIEKYMHEGVFTGIFSLIQVFVAMEPNETVYFANPGPDGKFNPDFYFHWADFNNEPINDWKTLATTLLNIPMAHQLIGFYTVADTDDGTLKVMRSYQYFAASRISDRVAKTQWGQKNVMGGYIWHTTGSGKTMTSFKSAQLIADSKDADKVIFLVDRIELGTQSLKEYRSFATDSETVQETENTKVLENKLRSNDPADTLIVTSIQKMGNVADDADAGLFDAAQFENKRLVFIIDECHRSTFGITMAGIKRTFPFALFFGFTGTPIHEENQKKMSTTTAIFGDELHRYSIADGIRDKNVLGFDPYKVLTFKDRDVRHEVALDKAKADNEEDAISDPAKSKVFYYYMNISKIGMTGEYDDAGKYTKGIEDYIPTSQYLTEEHRVAVVEDILDGWTVLSRGGKFHALFATSSIPEAIEYYRLFKKRAPELKVTSLFDPNVDNTGEGQVNKEDGLVEIIEDYNARYNKDYTIPKHAGMKKDIAARLAHKDPYIDLEKRPDEQIDLLIVVDQMLTGFDSKWLNTLYLDKLLHYEEVIQAFSRTNRLFGPDKPFGTIRYYRRPHTMEKNIEDAVKLYSGDKPFGLFVNKINENMAGMDRIFREIEPIFENAGIKNFAKLPEEKADRAKFAKSFAELQTYLEAATIQGFNWEDLHYEIDRGDAGVEEVALPFDQQTYLTLVQRYKELERTPHSTPDSEVPYDIKGYITEIDTGLIDSDYMNSNFRKWLKAISQGDVSPEVLEHTQSELHRSFASLSQEEQKYAELFLHDVQSGDVVVEEDKTFRDYITEYQVKAKNAQVLRVVEALGVDEDRLEELMTLNVTEDNLNEYGRFSDLTDTVDKEKAKAFFEEHDHEKVPAFRVPMRTAELLERFILEGGFDID